MSVGPCSRRPPRFGRFSSASGVEFEAGIRPEHLNLVDPAQASIRAGVTDIEPLGLKSVITAQSEGTELRLVVDAAQARTTGARRDPSGSRSTSTISTPSTA